MEEIKIFAPASVANVSCGFDVLGFCLDPVGDEMIIRKTKTPGVKISKILGQNLPLEVKKNVAGVAAEAMLSENPSIFGFEIDFDDFARTVMENHDNKLTHTDDNWPEHEHCSAL